MLSLGVAYQALGIDTGTAPVFLGYLPGLAHESVGLPLPFGNQRQRVVLSSLANHGHFPAHLVEYGRGFIPNRCPQILGRLGGSNQSVRGVLIGTVAQRGRVGLGRGPNLESSRLGLCPHALGVGYRGFAQIGCMRVGFLPEGTGLRLGLAPPGGCVGPGLLANLSGFGFSRLASVL